MSQSDTPTIYLRVYFSHDLTDSLLRHGEHVEGSLLQVKHQEVQYRLFALYGRKPAQNPTPNPNNFYTVKKKLKKCEILCCLKHLTCNSVQADAFSTVRCLSRALLNLSEIIREVSAVPFPWKLRSRRNVACCMSLD